MADVKITALPAASAAATTQLIPVVNDPSGTPATQKLTVAQLATLLQTALGVRNKTGAGTPVGSATPDYVGQTYFVTTDPFGLWFATGLTNADWVQLIGEL